MGWTEMQFYVAVPEGKYKRKRLHMAELGQSMRGSYFSHSQSLPRIRRRRPDDAHWKITLIAERV